MQKIGACTITTEADVDSLVFDWGTIHMLSEENVTGSKSISFGTVVLQPGKGHIRHNHPDADEIIYFISGEGEQMLDDHPAVKCTGGACIWIPKGIYHSTVNTGDSPLHLVVAYIPAGSEQALRQDPAVQVIPAGSKG
ncbi:MAG: cupin domain-containing protein [bacterium]|nr:cupin domain-containing protein [bacterium]